jgi:ferredoxin
MPVASVLECALRRCCPYCGRVGIDEPDACMECGACARNCPAEALSVRSGVGCAAAVINAALGRKSSACCCAIEPEKGDVQAGSQQAAASGCC